MDDQIKVILSILKKLDNNEYLDEIVLKDTNLKFLTWDGLTKLIKSSQLKINYLDSDSDLISGSYEGGFKIWECTLQLLNYLVDLDLSNLSVLDIGCGAGLLGTYCFLKNASFVHYLDFNKEVLDWFTLPNLIINLNQKMNNEKDLVDSIKMKSDFFPGDWADVDTNLENLKYDLILTSETIYCKENYPKLVNLIKNHLKPDGKALVATKTYYFGVGGGVIDFLEFVEQDNSLNFEQVRIIKSKIQLQILKLNLK